MSSIALLKNNLKDTMKKFISLLIVLLVAMKQSTAIGKLTIVSMVSLGAGIGALISTFFRSYVFPDANFIIAFYIMIMLDTVFGVLRHVKENSFNPEIMVMGLLKKLAIGVGIMMFTKVLLNLPEVIAFPVVSSIIIYFLKASIVSWLGLSFFGNCYILSGNKIPPKVIMKRFEKFSETLDMVDLTDKDSKVNKEEI